MSVSPLGRTRAPFVALLAALLLPACGRSGLTSYRAAEDAPECVLDADCPGWDDACAPAICLLAAPPGGGRALGRCVSLEPVSCDDGDPCTSEVCNPETGACSYALATFDNDGDGFRGPRPGFAPGEVGACGDDCDDTSGAAFPGGNEICDGFDNDCNGVVDDGADFVPVGFERRISGNVDYAGAGGIAWSGDVYASVYWGSDGGFRTYLALLDAGGNQLNGVDEPLSLNSGDGAGGPVIWTGDRFGVAWQDRRTGDYETYFTFLDGSGAKKHADTQLSFAPGFSVNVTMTWTGSEFVAAWQDQRLGTFDVFAQRLTPDAVPVASNVQLTQAGVYPNESPVLAKGQKTLGLTWAFGDASVGAVEFRAYDLELNPASPEVVVTDGVTKALYPTIVWNTDRYIVAWYDDEIMPRGIFGAALDEAGTVLVPPTRLTDPGPAGRSRYPQLKPLGDRLLLLYADDRDGNDGYELYARSLTPDLAPLTAETRITFAARDSIYPVATFGPEGTLGILFRDDRDGTPQVFFTSLACTSFAP